MKPKFQADAVRLGYVLVYQTDAPWDVDKKENDLNRRPQPETTAGRLLSIEEAKVLREMLYKAIVDAGGIP